MNTIAQNEINSLFSKRNVSLANKLMKSEFFTPVKWEDDTTFINTVYDDESVFMKLYVKLDDYNRFEKEIDAVRGPFEMTFNMFRDLLDGFIICFGSDEILIDEKFIENNLSPYTSEQLREIQKDLSYSIEDSVQDSIFLTLLLSDEDYTNNANEGIINCTSDMHFNMATTEIDGKLYHPLFTSRKHLIETFEIFPDDHHYIQIIDLGELVRHMKDEDIAGVLFDFPTGFQFMSIEELTAVDLKDNPKLANSLDYVFEV